ncbi:Vascular cell adhesion protein 1 [Collichthys lucidus]|uniref:Vascular cell adhesion protein 1 n=1 Tax=Collichthys lucidus TaxID=240159 RepID=A0A4U5U472_COLLU|nr:Vascular cell adhesion protein 1 [Collichthys lucidus]
MTEWDSTPLCHYTIKDSDDQCCSDLPITVYQPPDNVSISFKNYFWPLFEGHNYTLLCEVQKVAPIKNLTVTFYKGQTALEQQQSNESNKKPVTRTFNLVITPREEDHFAQYWCEAKLELGPEGPQPPPVVISRKIKSFVYYKPRLEAFPHPDVITITEGERLQLNCLSVGNPMPSYFWTLPSESIHSSWRNLLTIDSVTPADGGVYTCSVSNSRGTINVQFEVKVESKVNNHNANNNHNTTNNHHNATTNHHNATTNHHNATNNHHHNAINHYKDNKSLQQQYQQQTDSPRHNVFHAFIVCSVLSSFPEDVGGEPPDNVSVSFVGHTLGCIVQNVAPVKNLTVTFYRGQTALDQQFSSNANKKPMTASFTLDITTSKKVSGGQYWCEAKLDLGPEGPQPPPVMSSQNITVAMEQPPDYVLISFKNHFGPMFEGHNYTLLCEVQKVAPIKNLTVTFYKGQTALEQQQSNESNKKPVTRTFNLVITPREEDDIAQYWCEAKLELGPEGPQPPPVVISQKITASVHCESDN